MRSLARRHAGGLRDQVLRHWRGHRVPFPDHPTGWAHGPHVPAGGVTVVLLALSRGQTVLIGWRPCHAKCGHVH